MTTTVESTSTKSNNPYAGVTPPQALVAARLAAFNGHGWIQFAGDNPANPRRWQSVRDVMDALDACNAGDPDALWDCGLRPPVPDTSGTIVHRTCGSTSWKITGDGTVTLTRDDAQGALVVDGRGRVLRVPTFPEGRAGDATRARVADYLTAIRGERGVERSLLALSPIVGD